METGLSDFHRMTVIIMKTFFQRSPAKIRTYRNYKKFYNHKFRETFRNTCNNDISSSIDICIRSLDRIAPLKNKYICGNHLSFMNKELSKAIMHRSNLRNNFLRHRSNENRNNGITVSLC